MSKKDTAFSKLNHRQKKCVTLYCSEGRKETYLNRIQSYRKVYETIGQKEQTLKNSAYRFFKSANVQAAIKELLPSNAYDVLFIRDQYLHHYEEAKKDGNRKDCLAILKEMAVHEGMNVKAKQATTDDAEQKSREEASERITQLTQKRNIQMMKVVNGKSKQA